MIEVKVNKFYFEQEEQISFVDRKADGMLFSIAELWSKFLT